MASALDEQKILKELAASRRIVMYKQNGDKVLQWAVTVKDCRICITHGQVGDNAKLQNQERVAKPKNVGRSNATDGHTQAVKESCALIRKKLDNLYVLKDDFEKAAEEVPVKKQKTGEPRGISADYLKSWRPQLAQSLHDQKRPPAFESGVWVQAKKDGVRNISALVDGEVVFQSRNGKINNNLAYLEPSVRRILEMNPGVILDGELFRPGVKFEDLVGASKKANDSVQLEYHVYDAYDTCNPEATFQQRFLNLFEGITEIGLVKVVPSFMVYSHEDVMTKHAEFVAAGDEGLMVKTPNSSLDVGKRSKNLLKVKDFSDSEEWKIVAYESAQGRDAGSVVFILESDDGSVKFNARPSMTLETRQRIFQECEQDFQNTYYGRRPTIKFQNLSSSGTPRFPVLTCLSSRDSYE